MDSIKIYSADGALLIDAALESSSAQDWGIMSENQVSLDFYTEECIILPASCYIEFEGQRFWLLEEYKPTENNSAEWGYQVRFLGAESLLSVTVVLNATNNLDEPIFNLTAPASQHLDFIVKNLNRRFPGMNWRAGSVPETENIHIEYVGTYASDALQTIVGDKYEWWVDDFVINVGRCEFGEFVGLGYENGLLGGITYSTANEMRSYAYLYPIGSTRNIDPSKYGYPRLQLPDGITRIDINPEQGLAELVESDAFADIFPRYVGTVTAVRTSSGKNEDGTSFTIYHIKDSHIPFDPNDYEIAGEVKHITFQSGELMGAEFEVNYDATYKEFEIITQFQDGGLSQLPGGTLIPKVGDKYVVWGISMPYEYYPLAEQEFLQAALTFVSESIKEASVYRATVDFIEVQRRGLRLRPGQRVRLFSTEYFPGKGYYDSRITRITRDLCYPDEVTIEVSSVVSKGTISRLRNSINDSAIKVASLGQSLKNYVDITSAQNIFGTKNFANGFTLAGIKMYKHPDGYVYLDSPLVLQGGLTMYGDDGTTVPSIFDALPIDGETIKRNANKELYVNIDGSTIKRDGNGALYVDETVLSVSGGGGGVADSVHWGNVIGKPSWIGSTKPSYKYSEVEERPDLSVYFLASNFTKSNIKSTLGISDWALESAKPSYTASEVGALGVNDTAADANKLGGLYSGYRSGESCVPTIASSGVMEIGFIIDFHRGDESENVDYSTRLRCEAAAGNTVLLPQRSGTLALTSDIPTKLSQLTDDIVAGKYLPLSGGTVNGNLQIGDNANTAFKRLTFVRSGHALRINNTDEGAFFTFGDFSTAGAFTIERVLELGDSGLRYSPDASAYYQILHSGNYSDYALPITGGTITGGHLDIISNDIGYAGIGLNRNSTDGGRLNPNYEAWQIQAAPNNNFQILNDGYGIVVDITQAGNIISNGGFTGNLTGNANSATKLSKKVSLWGNEFDGTKDIAGPPLVQFVNFKGIDGSSVGYIGRPSLMNDDIHLRTSNNISIYATNVGITGAMAVDGDATFSSKVIVGTIPVYESADGTLYVDANVVFRGGVAMYGNTTTTINEE